MFLFAQCLSSPCYAQPEPDHSPVKVNLGVFGRTQSVFRGVVVWPAPSMMLGPSLVLWDRLFVLGPMLRYKVFPDRRSKWELNLSAIRFDDGKPWIRLGYHKSGYRNLRPVSYEGSAEFKYKFGERNLYSIGASAFQDFSTYHGLYGELNFGVPVFPFTSFLLDLGASTPAAAEYAYGAGAKSGLSVVRSSLRVFLPFIPWGGILFSKLSYAHILQSSNQSAYFVQGHDHNWSFETLLSWRIY